MDRFRLVVGKQMDKNVVYVLWQRGTCFSRRTATVIQQFGCWWQVKSSFSTTYLATWGGGGSTFNSISTMHGGDEQIINKHVSWTSGLPTIVMHLKVLHIATVIFRHNTQLENMQNSQFETGICERMLFHRTYTCRPETDCALVCVCIARSVSTAYFYTYNHPL